jgi:hypothetical protein
MALRASYRNVVKPTVLVDDEVAEEYEAVADAMRTSLKALGREAA